MGVVSLRERGLIFEEDFRGGKLSPEWEITPNDPSRWAVSEGNFRLKHGDTPLFVFHKSLTDVKRFVLDVKNEYKPTMEQDLGGLVVYADQEDAIYLEEYYDAVHGTLETYPWLRLVRDYNKYYGYWSSDGVVWHLIGSNYFDRLAPKIGLFLEGCEGEPLDVKYVRALKDTKVTVGNLYPGTEVRVLDKSGEAVLAQVCREGYSEVVFDLSGHPIPFQGRFSVSVAGGEWIEDDLTYNIWGGDVYSFEITPDLYVVDQETGEEKLLRPGIEGFLGYLTPDSPYTKDTKVIVRSRLPGMFEDITYTLREYKGKDHFQRLVELAPDNDGEPGEFGDSIHIPRLDKDDEFVFWVRIHRESDPNKFISELYFGLDVTSRYFY